MLIFWNIVRVWFHSFPFCPWIVIYCLTHLHNQNAYTQTRAPPNTIDFMYLWIAFINETTKQHTETVQIILEKLCIVCGFVYLYDCFRLIPFCFDRLKQVRFWLSLLFAIDSYGCLVYTIRLVCLVWIICSHPMRPALTKSVQRIKKK